MQESATSYNSFLPIYWSKQHFTYVSADENGLVFDWIIEPGTFVPGHAHLDVAEIFHITDGELSYKIDGKPVLAAVGDTLTVDIGVRHSIKNRTQRDAKARVEYRPCSDMAINYKILGDLVNDNPNDPMIAFKLLYLTENAGLNQFASLTPPIANEIVVSLSRLLGKILGWKKSLANYIPQ